MAGPSHQASSTSGKTELGKGKTDIPSAAHRRIHTRSWTVGTEACADPMLKHVKRVRRKEWQRQGVIDSMQHPHGALDANW